MCRYTEPKLKTALVQDVSDLHFLKDVVYINLAICQCDRFLLVTLHGVWFCYTLDSCPSMALLFVDVEACFRTE